MDTLIRIWGCLVWVFTLGRYTVYSYKQLMALTYKQMDLLRERLDQPAEVTRDQVDMIIRSLDFGRAEAIGLIAGRLIESSHVPLLPAIGKDFLGARIQMRMIQYNGEIGFSGLTDADICDKVKSPPRCAYWLGDVQTGDEFRDKSPQDAEVMIKERGCSCLTATEVIALGIHYPKVLYCQVVALGSRFRNDNTVPVLFLGNSRSELLRYEANEAGANRGLPSCRYRV